MTSDLQTQERELEAARKEVRNLQVIQMRPGLSAGVLEMLKDMEQSARAEAKARLKVIEDAKRNPSRLRRWLANIARRLGNVSGAKIFGSALLPW